MAFNRWDWLEGLKAESAIAVAVKYMAKLIADELFSWPPEVSLAQGPASSRFSELFEAGAPRPSIAAFEQAIQRARLELARDYDAINFYERNHHLAKACPEPREQLASEFIQHYILESFFVLMEKTNYQVKRKDALVGIDLLERRIGLLAADKDSAN
jgi:hypothetical protein